MRLLLVTEGNEFSENIQKFIDLKSNGKLNEKYRSERFLSPANVSNIKGDDFDCIICDGRFYAEIKASFNIPIFIVVKSTHPREWMEILNQGADGVLFADLPGEVAVAQISAFLRRWNDQRRSSRRFLDHLGLLIDLDRYQVELDGNVLDVTLTELKVLKELASESEKVIPRMMIQEHVFGRLAPGNRSLDVHICSLRKKLRPHGVDVESVRGVGYRLLSYGRPRAAKIASP